MKLEGIEMKKQAIGFLDSGVGGLTVVAEAMKQLPNESFYYFGDTARCPYGPRPTEQVKEFTWEIANFLLDKDIKMLVIACNTATAAALQDLKEKLDIPVVGVILPGSRAAIKTTENNKVGIIGTEGTIHSNEYHNSIEKKNRDIQTKSIACPKFVPVVESNQYKSPIAKKVVRESLAPFKYSGVDTLILGCTHYPLLKSIIQNVMGDEVNLIDSGAETVSELSVLLDYYDLAEFSTGGRERQMKFFTTGSANQFKELTSDWLGIADEDLDVSHIDLTEVES